MSQYPLLSYSMNAVRRAGERLSHDIIIDEKTSKEEHDLIQETFAIAHSWRNSHFYPMRSLRYSVISRMKAIDASGFTASRPKRMSSIRKKLRRFSVKLDQINDIAGCRAILDDISGVNNLISNIRESFPHKIRQEYSYIDSPKLDGYRSHHFVFEFRGNNDGAIYNGKRVELQIRTRLQHSWATAVEAVGLYRGEDMKGGKGNSDWLRLFALMSAELAYAENCPTHPDVKNRNGRLTEIIQLNNKLRAVGTLEDIKNVTHFSEHYIHERPRYYLIRYSADHTVTVESYSNAIEGAANIDKSEVMIETGDDDSKVVLVEVDKVDKLVEAYPNYFGDVSLFIRNLKSICEGKNAIEYSMAPQKLVAPKPYEKPDYSWLIRQFNKLVR